MAHIDTDQHRLHVAHLVGQFEVEQVAAHLAIELFQDVGGLGEVEGGEAALSSHDLRGDVVELVQLLVLVVEVLPAEDHDKHLREAHIFAVFIEDVILDRLLNLIHLALIIELDPEGFLNYDLELSAGLDQSFIDVVSWPKVIAAGANLVHEDPFISTKVDSLVNRESLHDLLVNVYDLVFLHNLRVW